LKGWLIRQITGGAFSSSLFKDCKSEKLNYKKESGAARFKGLKLKIIFSEWQLKLLIKISTTKSIVIYDPASAEVGRIVFLSFEANPVAGGPEPLGNVADH